MCAAQAAATLVALIARAGLGFLDPIAALVVSAIAVKEYVALWRGESADCCARRSASATRHRALVVPRG